MFVYMSPSKDLFYDGAVSLSILPTTAKRFDEMNACAHLKVGRLGQRQLIRHQGALGVNDGEIVHEAGCVLDLRETSVVFRRLHRFLQAADLGREGVQVG